MLHLCQLWFSKPLIERYLAHWLFLEQGGTCWQYGTHKWYATRKSLGTTGLMLAMTVFFADMTLTLHKSQVHCFGNMQLWACRSLNSLLREFITIVWVLPHATIEHRHLGRWCTERVTGDSHKPRRLIPGVKNLFAIAGHFVSYRCISGPHKFLVILWNLLKRKN